MQTLNISARSEDPRARMLSNLGPGSFTLVEQGKGVGFGSREGFIIGIKFPPGDSRRRQTFAMQGFEAKRMSRKAAKAHGRELVWWNGQAVIYGSTEHHKLIAMAIGSCFAQNGFLLEALVATADCELIHNFGRPESPNTSLPARVFIQILNEIRAEIVG